MMDKGVLAEMWIAYWRQRLKDDESPNLSTVELEDEENENGLSFNIDFDLPKEKPELCWDVILEILARIDTEEAELYAVLAAGLIEDLLRNFGSAFIDRVEEEARRNPRFNYLLGGVWRSSMPAEVWGRVIACRGDAW